MDLLFLIAILVLTYATGSAVEKNHFKNIIKREKAHVKQPYVSYGKKGFSEDKKIKKVEFDTGEVVISGDYFKTFVSAFRNFIGGRMVSYESLLDRARREAILRMREKAPGANVIINTRLESAMLNDINNSNGYLPQIAVIAYGTAITYTS